MLARSFRSPASAKRKIVVTMIPAGVLAQQAAQVVLRLGHRHAGQAHRGELADGLLDEIEPIEHDEDGGRVEVRLLAQLRRGKGHHQRLAGALVLPHQALPAARVATAGHDRLDRLDLRVAGDDLGRVATGGGGAARVERVGAQDVEQELGREQQARPTWSTPASPGRGSGSVVRPQGSHSSGDWRIAP